MAKVKVKLGPKEFEVDLVCKKSISQAPKKFTGWIFVQDREYILHRVDGVDHNEYGPALYSLSMSRKEVIEVYKLNNNIMFKHEFLLRTSRLARALYGLE